MTTHAVPASSLPARPRPASPALRRTALLIAAIIATFALTAVLAPEAPLATTGQQVADWHGNSGSLPASE